MAWQLMEKLALGQKKLSLVPLSKSQLSVMLGLQIGHWLSDFI